MLVVCCEEFEFEFEVATLFPVEIGERSEERDVRLGLK